MSIVSIKSTFHVQTCLEGGEEERDCKSASTVVWATFPSSMVAAVVAAGVAAAGGVVLLSSSAIILCECEEEQLCVV